MTWDTGSRVLPALLGVLALGAATTAAPAEAWALDAERAYTSASQQIGSVTSGLGAIQAAIHKSRGEQRTPAQRIADAQLLMGSRDYERAANVLNQVVEKYPDHPTAFPDALTLLGETYFRSKQYLSARRVFLRIVASGAEPRFAAYQAKALGRLVDICLRIKDYDALDAVFASMNSVPASTAGSALAYARGKGLYVKKDFGGAKASLGAVDPQSEYFHQARYLLGLIAVKEATPPPEPLKEGEAPPAVPKTRYVAAIDLFQKVTQLPADTPEHRRVIDLAWLAIGRLFYEADQWSQAVQAYGHIDRVSPEFGAMLYELAWVYVRLGDVDRAQRSLEILAIAEPDSQNIADGSLLRGDLMLRAGRFEKALKVYEGVRATYDPMRARVDAFLGSTSDPAVYYDKLSQEQLEALDTTTSLPPLAVQWAREAEDGPAAFAVIDDINHCRELIKQSNELIEKLNAVLSSPNRVRAFPELKAGEEQALSLLNRVALARLALGQGMDDVEDDSLSGEIGGARARRRALEKRLARVPVTDADFQDREAQALKQWNTQSQRLQQLTLQMDSLQATVNGLRRLLRDGPHAGVVRDPASIARFEIELAQNERDLALYRQQADVLRKQVSAGRVQVGFGDQRFIEDAQVRKAHRDALTREVELAAAGAGGAELAAYAQRITPVLRAGDAADARVEAALRDIEGEVAQKSSGLRQIVGRETANVVHYSVQLDGLDREARLVVGEVAMRNFGLVRDRLKNIILRADVGITEEAWEVREEQMTRVRSLQVERAREDRVLKEELNEVLDDSGDPEDEK
ncbi:tetratricopeptide repeat protein [Sorangium sp. So ce448]|uniref:tetratricopeptide repeat protein n=1 Tax=Sorangium sp. So ce448 TaxID=3133314 RepID=UPI003F6246BD